MKKTVGSVFVSLIVLSLIAGCTRQLPQGTDDSQLKLVGAWRANIQFSSGAYAVIKDLEFMYVFNSDGTMLESSNYDAAPPVPPAYGVWRKIGENQFEAKYEFFVTKAPAVLDGPTTSLTWMPSGRGVLLETIALASDGKSFTSKIDLDMYDQSGTAIEGGGEATGEGERIEF